MQKRIWLSLLIGGVAMNSLIAQPTTRPTTHPAHANWKSFDEMHQAHIEAFVANDNFGSRRMRRGDSTRYLLYDDVRYVVASNQLVGLLKHDRPVVYVMDYNPTTDRIKESETRDLTEWESETLKLLRGGAEAPLIGAETILIGEGLNIRAMGALRARESCLECHQDMKAGDLMGAFTYILKPLDPPATQPAEK